MIVHKDQDDLEKQFPDPPDWLVSEAWKFDVNNAVDRAWIPSAWPGDFKSIMMCCMCGGVFEYKHCPFVWPNGKEFGCWLGQCSKCEHIFWASEDGV